MVRRFMLVPVIAFFWLNSGCTASNEKVELSSSSTAAARADMSSNMPTDQLNKADQEAIGLLRPYPIAADGDVYL